ncbi:hypothetical protein P154DRAFT_525230 [Amniculicola lignicola CBS 123094]|uniref:Uncharacterized protein n=1 Tax=Amniculicola lignicola CBS 123094 TaxID=1392246 RepID=A0A6A5W4Z7_9PLEO|nr:hypothetical protein P154DRAFT_525230 [Amniculicola lignicola CBS 123094]
MRRAYWVETAYLREQKYDAFATDLRISLLEGDNPIHLGPRAHVAPPLVQDVGQLHYHRYRGSPTYDHWLGLNYDGTAKPECQGREYWIYVGGTAKPSSDSGFKSNGKPEGFQHLYKKHSCEDPAYMCDDYNEAFDRISARWHGMDAEGDKEPHSPGKRTSDAILRFVDCDVTPLFCSWHWGMDVGAVMLIHMKIGNDCEYSMGIGRCSVEWRFVALPLHTLPWTRMIRIPLDKGGSTVVPAFPDAEESLWSLMSQSGAETALNSDNYVDSTYTPVEGQSPNRTAGLGLEIWGNFRAIVDNPFERDEWPKEIVIKCYIQRYLDVFLGWWDGSHDAVFPRDDCGIVEEERDRDRRLADLWADIINKPLFADEADDGDEVEED